MKIILLAMALLILFVDAKSISQSQIEELSSSRTWLKLLHYRDGKSSIIDNNFFLDENGHISAKKELLKTIKAYDKPFDKSDEHAQCRFPARYFWLSKHIELKEYNPVNPKCTKLKNWKLLKDSKSISVVFVSGYLGNPASAFGHSFIKVNQSNDTDDNLFDTSISYGALLPPKYTMPEYIYNGLTGGYKSAYSDKYYYNQDVTYSNEEYRDMWEYRLNLDEEKRKLFLLHAWELMGKKFQYFFLNRNCGYQVSDFLELLYGDMIESATIWYAPIETLYKLKSLDGVIEKVVYIPSKQQRLYAHYSGLSHREKDIAKEMITKKLSAIPSIFEEHNSIEKANALDFVLAYRRYTSPKHSNRTLLLNRFKFPIRKKAISKVKDREDVSNSNQLSYLGLGIESDGARVNWSSFAIESEGDNRLNGDEMVLFDMEISIKKNNLKLSELDLIRIKRFKTKQMPFEEENPWSWNLHIGAEDKKQRDYFVKGGVGLAWDFNDNMKFFSMLNLSAHSQERHYRVLPNMGLFINLNRLRLSTIFGYEKDIEEGKTERIIDINGQYSINRDFSFFWEYNLNRDEAFQLGVKQFY